MADTRPFSLPSALIVMRSCGRAGATVIDGANGIARKVVAFAQSAILDVDQCDLLTLTIVGKHSVAKCDVAACRQKALTTS